MVRQKVIELYPMFFDLRVSKINALLKDINKRKGKGKNISAFDVFWKEKITIYEVFLAYNVRPSMVQQEANEMNLVAVNGMIDGDRYEYSRLKGAISKVEDISLGLKESSSIRMVAKQKEYWRKLANMATQGAANISYLDLNRMDWEEALYLISQKLK